MRQANSNSSGGSGPSISVSLELVLAYLEACGKSEADLIPFMFQTMTADPNADIIQELHGFVDVKFGRFMYFCKIQTKQPALIH